MNPDVPADVCLLPDSALSEKGGSMFVGDQRNRLAVQEKVQFPHKANGYYGAVPTTEVVVNFLDKMGNLAGSKGHYRYPECRAEAG